MNYYIPYFNMSPGVMSAPKGLFSGIKWGSILNNTSRALGFINQAIPVVKQVSPIVRNAKTMFRVMNEFKKADTPITNNVSNAPAKSENIDKIDSTKTDDSYELTDGAPTFFI